jgi:hypothetical protein
MGRMVGYNVHPYGVHPYGIPRALRRPPPPPSWAHFPWRDVINLTPRIGDLRIEESLDRELHRYVRTAKLFDVQSAIYSAKLPELLDVRLMARSPQAFTLTGFERVATEHFDADKLNLAVEWFDRKARQLQPRSVNGD